MYSGSNSSKFPKKKLKVKNNGCISEDSYNLNQSKNTSPWELTICSVKPSIAKTCYMQPKPLAVIAKGKVYAHKCKKGQKLPIQKKSL